MPSAPTIDCNLRAWLPEGGGENYLHPISMLPIALSKPKAMTAQREAQMTGRQGATNRIGSVLFVREETSKTRPLG